MAEPLSLGSAAAAIIDEIDAKAADTATAKKPAPAGTALEAGLRGAASSLTLGASEFFAGHNPALWLARQAQEQASDAAQRAAVDAARSGDLDARISAEAELTRQRARLAEIKAEEDSFNSANRARTAALIESHPVAHGLGEVAGLLVPTGPVAAAGKLAATTGRLAARVPGLISKAARFSAEGAAMGLQAGIEEAGISGELSGSKIARSALTGAAVNGVLGLGGLGLTTTLGKAFKGGASKALGIGEDVAARAGELSAVTGKLRALDEIAAQDATGVIGARLAEVRAAEAKGLFRAVEDAELTSSSAALSAAEAAAQKSRSILKEALLREAKWAEDPVVLLRQAEKAKTVLADVQAGIQKRAAEWLKDGADKYLPYLGGAIGLSGSAAHGDDDVMSGAVGMVGKVLLGAVTARVAGGMAVRMFGGKLAGAISPAVARAPAIAEGLAGPAVTVAGRVATSTGLRVLNQDEFDAAKKHVDALNLAAPEINRATAGALVDAGWSPLAAQDAADRRVASLGLLGQKAAQGDRIGFSRVLYALSSPQNWQKEARGGLLTPEHIEAYRTLAPTVAANIAYQARSILADKTQAKGLKPRARRMLELWAQTEGQRVGTIQQAAYGPAEPKPPPAAASVRHQAQPTAAQATEERATK